MLFTEPSQRKVAKSVGKVLYGLFNKKKTIKTTAPIKKNLGFSKYALWAVFFGVSTTP